MARKSGPVRRQAPRLPVLREAPGDLDVLDETGLEGLAIADLELSGRSARLVEFDGCELTGARLATATLRKLSILDCRLARCDLANATCPDAALTRVEVRGSRLTGAAFAQASLRHVLFADCAADMLSLRLSAAMGLELVDCRLRSADFTSADLRGARFVRCDLREADFSLSQVSGSHFVDCVWEGVRGVTSLSGAVVVSSSPYDLIAFAEVMAGGLGITLRDAEDGAED